ncbi:MAG TPA: class I SAM-dependent methyltransferase, partial [Candidatus Lokiarchaeia archaeon]|nr:class I SAM-dependent methyltransferase [Candidatus Lokiarchaeia archaeon]
FAAHMYGKMTSTKALAMQVNEIAQDLVLRIDQGRLLDVGTGPGRLLAEVHRLNPAIELYGLDISDGMVSLAQQNLIGMGADLRVGNICEAPYDRDFFDLVTCTGSFYLWNNPRESLDEIYRILKPGQAAYLFESHKDYDSGELKQLMKENLKGEGFFKRKLMPTFLQKQLRMTYSVAEVQEIVEQTQFAENYTIDKITLARLPIWQRIELRKS